MAIIDGGGIKIFSTTLSFNGSTSFTENSAVDGGGISVSGSTLTFVGYNAESDSEMCHGDCKSSCTVLFMQNFADYFGGAVSIERSRNSARLFGGGVHSQNSTLKFIGNTNFSSNSVLYNGGGIHGEGTSLYFGGISSFIANTAGRGGGSI